jgi:hypothetical protein
MLRQQAKEANRHTKLSIVEDPQARKTKQKINIS